MHLTEWPNSYIQFAENKPGMLKEYLNTALQLSLVVWLFSTAMLVKPELFNGIVTGKQYGLELAAACVAGYLIIFLPVRLPGILSAPCLWLWA